MSKRVTAFVPQSIRTPDPELEAWHIAHDARQELAGVLLRLQLFARLRGSAPARQAAVLIEGALTKLDDLEEEAGHA
jgi:hypothetical protein